MASSVEAAPAKGAETKAAPVAAPKANPQAPTAAPKTAGDGAAKSAAPEAKAAEVKADTKGVNPGAKPSDQKPAGASAADAAKAPAPGASAAAGAAAAATDKAAADKAAADKAAADKAPEPVTPPSPEAVAEAKQRFDRGLELYAEGDYPLALIEFNRAYELVPNYRVLYNIGQVCIQLGQYANARRALSEYRDKGGDELSMRRKESVGQDLEMLERRTAYLLVTSNVPDAEVIVDDVSVGKTPLSIPLLVDAGVHRVSVRRNGYLPRSSRVTLAGGDEQTLPLTLEKQPEAKPTIVVQRPVVEDDSSTLMIAGWVTTGALAAGAIVTGIMGAGEAKELKELRAADPADYSNLGARMDSTKSNASSLLLASDVFSGAAVIVGGLSLWITIDPPKSASAPGPERPAPTPPKGGLQVGYQEQQIKLRGSF